MSVLPPSTPSALLISIYELGHQPFGLASPAAWLRRAGIDTSLADLAREKFDESLARSAGLVAELVGRDEQRGGGGREQAPTFCHTVC